MSLDDSGDGIRLVTPIVFFAPGENQAAPINKVSKVEEDEKPAAPKDSSARESASSSSGPVVPEQTQTESPSPSSPALPAPPTPTATADKASGKPKASESSTPTG